MVNLTWAGWGNTLTSGAHHSFGDLSPLSHPRDDTKDWHNRIGVAKPG